MKQVLSIAIIVMSLLLPECATALEKGKVVVFTSGQINTSSTEDTAVEVSSFSFFNIRDFIMTLKKQQHGWKEVGRDCTIRDILSTDTSDITVIMYCDDTSKK